MADMTEAYAALERAHAAGKKEDAQKIADYIRANDMGRAPTEGVSALPVHPAEMAADLGKDAVSWFSTNEPKEVSMSEAAGAVGGGAVGGAVAGATLPGILKTVGKFVPGVIGKGMQALGEGMSVVPLSERVVKGAGGGAAMAGVDTLGDAFGAPKALTLAGSLVGGGLGESAASFLTKESGQLLRFIGNASYGNVAGASRALGGMLQPNKPLNSAMAERIQKRLFGEKTEGYVNGLVGSDNRQAVQEALRAADPSLVPGPRVADAPRAPWAGEASGEMQPMSSSTAVAAAAGPSGKPMLPQIGGPAAGEGVVAMPGAPQGLPGSGAAQGTGGASKAGSTSTAADDAAFAAGKAGAAAKARTAAQQAADAETAAAAEALKPASEIYRDRMFNGVTEAVKSGKTFTSTPEYQQFADSLQHQVTMGNVPAAKAQELLRQLRLDQAKGPQAGKVLGSYAEQVDNNIRRWGKPAEGSIATGADAIDSGVSRQVRADLQQAYNSYTSRLGLGNVEQQYRSAYSQEMIAEAKDKLPHFLYGFESGKEFAKMARNLAQDGAGREFIQASVAKHLAQQEPKQVLSEFERLQGVLVNAKMLQPADLKELRDGAATIKRVTDKGQQLKMGATLKQMLLVAMARSGGEAAGAAAGRSADTQQQQEQ